MHNKSIDSASINLDGIEPKTTSVFTPNGSTADQASDRADAIGGVSAARTIQSGVAECPKCGAIKIARSRPQSSDRLVMRLLPRRPFRCLRCYHRFWVKEPFFADTLRARSWTALVTIFILLPLLWFAWQTRIADGRVASGDGPGAAMVMVTAPEPAVVEEPVIAPETSLSQDRQIIQDSGFQAPASAIELPSMGDLQRLTPEQTQLRIREARAAAAQIREANEARRAALREFVADSPEELRSLLKVEINYRLDEWRRAWEAGDSERYLSFYSEQFAPANGMSLAAWRDQRKQRVTPAKQIKLELRDFKVVLDESNQRAEVSIAQVYRSNSFNSSSLKQLDMIKEHEQWYIQAERSI